MALKLPSGADLEHQELLNAILQVSTALTMPKQLGYNLTHEELAWYTTTGTIKSIRDLAISIFSQAVADINLNNNKVINLAPGVNPQDAVNVAQLSAVSAGLDPKESVRVATTADIGGTYNSTGGTNGTGSFTGAATVIDGVGVGTGTRILVKDQTDNKQNGIYKCTSSGSYERAADHDGGNKVSGGNYTLTEAGTANAGKGYSLLGSGVLTLNTDPIVWTQFNNPGTTTGGTGIAQSGNTLYLQNASGDTTLFFGTDDLKVNLAATSGLEDVSGLRVKINGTSASNLAAAIHLGSSGLSVKIDSSTLTVNGSNQLKVNQSVVPAWREYTSVGGDQTEVFTHNLNNRDLIVIVRRISDNQIAMVGVTYTTVNSITVDFGSDPGTSYRVMVIGLDKN